MTSGDGDGGDGGFGGHGAGLYFDSINDDITIQQTVIGGNETGSGGLGGSESGSGQSGSDGMRGDCGGFGTSTGYTPITVSIQECSIRDNYAGSGGVLDPRTMEYLIYVTAHSKIIEAIKAEGCNRYK